MTRPFSETTAVRKGTAVVTVAGDIREDAAADLCHAILKAVNSPDGPDVLVDLAAVTFVDDSGLETLVVCDRAAQLLGGTLHLNAPSPAVMEGVLEGLHGAAVRRKRIMRSALQVFRHAGQAG